MSREEKARRITVVGVGAAEGGVGALQRFFQAYEAGRAADAEIAFIVLHVAPEREGPLPALLRQVTTMPVRQVNGRLPLQSGHIYLVPPDRPILCHGTHLEAASLPQQRGRPTPLDDLFRSLAAAHSDPAAAVILSGKGVHGAVGIKAIKESGGLLLVQHPHEAEHDGMPRAAIAAGLADVVLDAAELARKLLVYHENGLRLPNHARGLGERERRLLARLLAEVKGQTGHDFSHYRRDVLLRCIQQRMQIHGHQTLDGYLNYLRHVPDEAPALFHDLLVGAATFFANAPAGQALVRQVLPALLAEKEKGTGIRAWSVGCATGEEAYTLAMLLLEEAAAHPALGPVRVFASDLDEEIVRRARAGVYPEVIEADVSPARLERFFLKEGDYYRVRQKLRDAVVFSRHTVLFDPPFARLDLISSHNLLDHLQRPWRRRVLEIFGYALNPGGVLFLSGKGATAVTPALFEPVNETHPIYRLRPGADPDPELPLTAPLPPLPAARPARRRDATVEARHRQLVESADLPSLLVDEEHRILYLSPAAGRYLRPRGGPMKRNLLQLIRPELEEGVQHSLNQAFYRGEATLTPPATLSVDGKQQTVVISIRPQKEREGHNREALLLFLAGEGAAKNKPLDAPPATGAEETIAELRRRLANKREAYRQIKAELSALREEFDVTTVELETSREELQSANEELRAVNEELAQKVEEISRAHGDLENFIAATDVVTLFLDLNLKVRRYSPNATALFNLRATDIGRPINHLTHNLAYESLAADAREALQEMAPLTREVQARRDGDEQWLLLRFRPYYRTEVDRIEGVILTFVEITELKETEAALRRRERELATLNKTLEARILQRTEKVRELAARLTMAEHEERDRVAQILHDELQQQLYAVRMQLQMVIPHIDEAEARQEAEEMEERLGDAFQLTRQLSVDLSPPILAGEGLPEAVRWLAAQMEERHNLAVTVTTASEGDAFPPPPDRRVLIFQMVRELLFNVVKHAAVSRATVQLRHEELSQIGPAYCIDVIDEGPGFDPEMAAGTEGASPGRGLRHMRERLSLIGGRLEIIALPGEGTRVTIIAPLDPPGGG